MSAAPKMSKAERLVVAGQIAPAIRQRAKAPRRVMLIDPSTPLDQSGATTVKRVAADVDVAVALAEREAIELTITEEAARAEWEKNPRCTDPECKVEGGKPLPVSERARAHRRRTGSSRCHACAMLRKRRPRERQRCTHPACDVRGGRLLGDSPCARHLRRRNGRAICPTCAARLAVAARPRDQMCLAANRGWETRRAKATAPKKT